MNNLNKNLISVGNTLFRNNLFRDSITNYIQSLVSLPDLSEIIMQNVFRAKKQYLEVKSKVSDEYTVGVVFGGSEHKGVYRAYNLASLYRHLVCETTLIGIGLSSKHSKMVDNIDVRIIDFDNSQQFIKNILEFISLNSYDVVHISNLSDSTILVAGLYELIWGSKIILDIGDDVFLCHDQLSDFSYFKNNSIKIKNILSDMWIDVAKILIDRTKCYTTYCKVSHNKYNGLYVPDIDYLEMSKDEILGKQDQFVHLSTQMKSLISCGTNETCPLYDEIWKDILNSCLTQIGKKQCLAFDSEGVKSNILNNRICADKIGAQPDLFALRSSEIGSRNLILTWVSNDNEMEKLLSSILKIKQDFELIILSSEHALQEYSVKNIGLCKNFYTVFFPSQTSRSSAFIRILNAGIIYKYQSCCWFDLSNKEICLKENIFEEFSSLKNYNVGVCAEGFEEIGTLSYSKEVLQNLNTWLPRLHVSLKEVHNHFSIQGSFIAKSILFRQIGALNIVPNNLEKLDMQQDMINFTSIGAAIMFFSEVALFSKDTMFSSDFQPKQEISNNKNQQIKAIAFYLPQFHRIDENDRWWGSGFTEWNNVIRAKPLFRSHYQPKLPADLGFYDLSSTATQYDQAQLAKEFGIHGFCYYYYWFNGRKILNKPIENMLNNPNIDIPFCVCWANENWSRNWDGQNKHVLLKQEYTHESNLLFIKEIIEMMRDDRYIRYNGKPVLVVYRIQLIPHWLDVARIWREECRKAGIGEIHLCSIRFTLEQLDGEPNDYGLDAYVLFPPQDMEFIDMKHKMLDLDSDFKGTIYSYQEVVDNDIKRFESGYPWTVHRGAMMGWDNTARRLKDSRIFVGCTPSKYRAWLSSIIRQDVKNNNNMKESLLFINAWNEWAEGTTLEPNQKFGKAFLEATHNVLLPYLDKNETENICSRTNYIQKRFRELKAPNLYEWFEGRVKPTDGNLNILLCAHVSGHQLFGGERSFLDVLKALQALNFNVIVTLPSGNNKEYMDLILDYAVGIYVVTYKQWVNNRKADPIITLNFCEFIAVHNIDIVYSNTIMLQEPALAARKMKKISIIHVRELITIDDNLREKIGLPVSTIIKKVFNDSDYIIANSIATYNVFDRVNKTYCIPNMVDLDDLKIQNKIVGKIRVGIVSSNIPQKGVADFLEVAKLCSYYQDLIDFVVIGPINSDVEFWQQNIKDGMLPSNIKFVGYRNTPREAMLELNILLNLSSFAESFGRTVAEAMAARRPVIAYHWGALPELVVHKENGYLVPFGDIEQVSKYVIELVKNKDLITSMGNNGYDIINKKFSFINFKNDFKIVFENIQKNFFVQNLSQINTNKVTIIIPVYNALLETKQCLESVLMNTSRAHVEILVINDCSSDVAIKPMLEIFEKYDVIKIIHNKNNMGYTKTINKAISLVKGDVVLLNSDTIVTPGWLSGMRASAYTDSKIGTVTAMSDNAGAFSFPIMGQANPKPNTLSNEDYAMRIIDNLSELKFVSVPTGSGFCMYIKREVIDTVGLFDDVLFPRGYGEENDYCMRVMSEGWSNIITTWSFVYHIKTASFKGEKEKLVKSGVDSVTKKYPNYAALCRQSFNSEEIQNIREVFENILKNTSHL